MPEYLPSAPMLPAARLWERTSKNGNTYMTGRLGGVKVLVMPNRDHNPDDPAQSHTHQLLFTEAQSAGDRAPAVQGGGEPARVESRAPARQQWSAPMDRGRKPPPREPSPPLQDDVIPF
ncbi:MAG: hypothetical protein M3Y22_01500 [Pseudomonadota bacterium]|nr:hypothetical protein [Pseudomonadota bacterium]